MAELSPLPRPLSPNPSVSAKKGVSCGVGLVHVGNSSSGEGWDPLKGALCLEPYLSPPELTPQKGHLLRSTENASPDSERSLGGTSPSKKCQHLLRALCCQTCVSGENFSRTLTWSFSWPSSSGLNASPAHCTEV